MAIVLDGSAGITTPDLTDTSLTSGRVVYAGTSGNLTGSSSFVFDGTNLGVGTNSPSTKFHVASSGSEVSRFETTSADMYLRFSNNFDPNGYIGYQNSALTFWTVNNLRATLSSTGLGIGTTNANPRLIVKQSSTNTHGIWVEASANDTMLRMYCDGTTSGFSASYGSTGSYLPITFLTSGSERMRLDTSGNLLVGATSVVGSAKLGVAFNGGAVNGLALNDTASASGSGYAYFQIGGTTIGSITRVSSTSAVMYNTTSDQRLKSNIANSESVINKLMQVQVRQYDWTEGQVHQDYGFIAQELEPVLSGVVTKGKADEDMWQLDYSRLTPHLVKAIQELNARLTALENK
jgi:hypothetical protein